MIKIVKIQPPQKLIEHQRSGIPIPIYGNMATQCKIDVEQSLIKEQRNICAYCNQILKKGKYSIEHHCEQTICNGVGDYPDKRIDCSNLLLVCPGNKGTKDQHCDKKKSEFSISNGLPIKLNPLQREHVDGITYTRKGEIMSCNPTHDHELNTILNLNQKNLIIIRGKKFRALIKHIDFKTKNFRKFNSIIQSELDSNPFTSNFPGLSDYLYKKYNGSSLL